LDLYAIILSLDMDLPLAAKAVEVVHHGTDLPKITIEKASIRR
jgi:hypothetical protein